MEFEHELELSHQGLSYKDLPLSLKTSIQNWERKKAKVYADPADVDKDEERKLKARSVAIADEVRAFGEKDLPDENQNQNNMPTKEEIEATEKEAAKKKAEEETAAAEAAKKKEEEEAAAKKKSEEEAAAAEAKKKEEEEAAAKKKTEEEAAAAAKKKRDEEDDDDIVPGVL